jgi:Co/Zn/Cd efflux system component
METFRDTLKWIWALAILAFWLWGIDNNDGLVAIGIPVVIFCYALATSNESKGGNSNEPRGGPWDGDGG